MRTTIRDIAAKTGFSIATVSMILNGKDSHISEATRNKVLAAAKEMNYVPNQAAITFNSGRSFMLGFICPDITNDYYSKAARALGEACDSRGYNLLLCNTDGSVEREKRFIDMFCSKNVDGAVVFNAPAAAAEDISEEIKKLESFDIPLVSIDASVGEGSFKNVSFILPDYHKGGCLAAEHLLSLGHRDVAVIEDPQQPDFTQKREQGFLCTMEKAGHPVPAHRRFAGSCDFGPGTRCAEDILACGATAVFAASDMLALSVIHEFLEKGIRVPEDISVVGFDNISLDEISEVRLTTLNNPAYEIGAKAGEMLFDMIDKKAQPGERVRFSLDLVVRSSTGPAK